MQVRCICDGKLTRTTPKQCYGSTYANCNGCRAKIGQNSEMYHCVRGKNVKEHPTGFDFCTKCYANPPKATAAVRCVCGYDLQLTTPIAAYGANSKVSCNLCHDHIDTQQSMYHCQRGKVQAHPKGYDVCFDCEEEKQPSKIKCINGHPCGKRRITDKKRYGCDICGEIIQEMVIDTCKKCNWDVCNKCCKLRLNTGASTDITTDKLTGLQNRQTFNNKMTMYGKNEWKNARHFVIFIDINDFDEYNKQGGHKYGDKVLETVGKLIKSHQGNGRMCYRYGGAAFVIIGARKESLQDGNNVGSSISKKSASVGITVSVCVAFGHPIKTVDVAKDGCMKYAKKNKNMVHVVKSNIENKSDE